MIRRLLELRRWARPRRGIVRLRAAARRPMGSRCSWRRCQTGLMPRGLSGDGGAKRFATRLFVLAKGLEGPSATVQVRGYSLRRLTARRGSGAGGGHHRRAEMSATASMFAPGRGPICAAGWRSRFAKTYHPSSMTRVLRRMGFSRQKARPSHPRRDAEAQERFKKGLGEFGQRHPEGDRRGASRQAIPTSLWFQDEASSNPVGNKGRLGVSPNVAQGRACPRSTRQIGYQWAYSPPPLRGGLDRRRRHPGDAERQRQGHGPVSRTLRRYPGPVMRTPS